jgi:hypothetical protein
MTLASALFGGGGGAAPYRAGNLYLANPQAISTGASVADTDYIIPFIPRVNMTLDRVAWYRDNTTAANVRVGLYSSAGTLLTDCAVDTNTVAGWHLVDTTNVSLQASEFYWLCWNASADCAGTQGARTQDAEANQRPPYSDMLDRFGLAVGIGTATNVDQRGVAQIKARTNAALLSTLTMSGWAETVNPIAMGVIPA